jgi:hypothetical protein
MRILGAYCIETCPNITQRYGKMTFIKMRSHFLLLIFFNLSFLSCQAQDIVSILPGKGIVLKNDTILLGDSSYLELAKKLHCEEVPLCCTNGVWECFMDDGRVEVFLRRVVKYDSISFFYSSCGDSINMILMEIKIKESKNLTTSIANKIFIGGPDSLIKKVFVSGPGDEIQETAMFKDYELYSKGVALFSLFNNIISISVISKKE